MCWKFARDSAALQRYVPPGLVCDLALKRGEQAELMRCLIYAPTEIRIIAFTRCRVSPRSSLKPIKSSFCILSVITRPIVPFLFSACSFTAADSSLIKRSNADSLDIRASREIDDWAPFNWNFSNTKSTRSEEANCENVRGVAGGGDSFIRKRNWNAGRSRTVNSGDWLIARAWLLSFYS